MMSNKNLAKEMNILHLFLEKHKHLTIKLEEDQCAEREYACVYWQDSPQTIWLTYSYFLRPPIIRISTLLHEIHHLLYEQEHQACKRKGVEHLSCDESMHSAFGTEIRFLEAVLKDFDQLPAQLSIADSGKQMSSKALKAELGGLYLRINP